MFDSQDFGSDVCMTSNAHEPPEVPDQSNTELIGWISCDGCQDRHNPLCGGLEADVAVWYCEECLQY